MKPLEREWVVDGCGRGITSEGWLIIELLYGDEDMKGTVNSVAAKSAKALKLLK
jgi:hypothetical protein